MKVTYGPNLIRNEKIFGRSKTWDIWSLSLFYFFVRSHVISPQSKHHLLWHEKDYDGELLLSPVWQLFFESLKQDRESASTLFCPFKLHFRVDGSTEEKRGTKDFQEGAFETFFLTKRRMTCLKSWVRKRPLHKHFLFRKSHRNFRYFSYFCKWHS